MATLVCEDVLRTFLLTSTDLTDLIDTKIYPDQAPQNVAMPYIVYFRISGQRVRSLDGPNRLIHPRLQYDVLAATRQEAKDIAAVFRNFLDGYQGDIGGLYAQKIEVSDDRDFFEEPIHGDEVGARGVSLDVMVWFH